MTIPYVIEVKDLVKSFPKVSAVRGVSFAIEKGKCFGLLGPNGAGKTTTIEMIEGITAPTSGEILFKGNPIGPDFRQKSGIQFQHTALQDHLTVKEVLELFRSFYDKPADLAELAELCTLKEYWNQNAHTLSGGQRQRVLLAVALVNDPEVVFLDEPTTGLDPQARRNFWNLIQMIKGRGKTIILTTHYMEEAYLLCDEIAIMDKGLIITQGAPNVLLKKHFQGVTLEIPRQDFPSSPASLSKEWKLSEKGEIIEIYTDNVNQTFKTLLENNVSLSQLKLRSQTLEDLFLQLTHRELRE